MNDSERADSQDASRLSREIDRLLRQYLADPVSPRVEEVRRLAEDLLLRNLELESKVGNLKTIAQQLEKYRDRYVDLYEVAPVGYATLDEDGYVQEINLAGAELLGRERDELIGYPLDTYVVAKDREEFVKQVRRCCCQRQTLSLDADLLNAAGATITAHLRGVPVESLEAEATFCKVAITDISERIAAEAAIRASEANYRAVFDTANDAIFVHDAETAAIVDVNQKATAMCGYTAEELRRLSVGDISEGGSSYSQEEAFRRLMLASAGEPQLFTWRCRHRSGRLLWVEVNIKRTTLNGVPRLLAIVRDIGERKAAEEALRDSEERFRTLAEYTYDWEYWRGRDGRFCYVSPSCHRITGYSPGEFLADPTLLEKIVHPDDRKTVTRHFRRESPNPAPHTAEYRIVSRAGEERWIEHICQPVYGVDQRWLGQRASNRDITDRKKSELALRERIAALEQQLSGRVGQAVK